MNLWTRVCVGLAAAGALMLPAVADPHAAKGLTLELVAAESSVRPGQTAWLGIILRPDEGFHTYWRQPGLVGLTPTIEWSLPAGIEAGEMLWPEPQRGMMAAYGVWCLKRESCLVTPIAVPASLDPLATPTVTFKASVVWMACSRTCHPGTAELTLTLPVRSGPDASEAAPRGASLITQTKNQQPVRDEAWKFSAIQHGRQGGFSLTITPPPGRSVPVDAYFFGHQRLVDSNVEPVRHSLPGGAVRIDLALVEEPDADPPALVGELWSAHGWGRGGASRLLQVHAPLTMAPVKP